LNYVIVGNGIAGIEAALALRARDSGSGIRLISDEHDHFYSRPALMYIFCGQLDLRATEPFDRELYERMGFERVRGHVKALDTAKKNLAFEDGRNLSYDKLLLAAGSKGREAPWPGAKGPGVHYFVTLQDLGRLDDHAKPGMRAVVIGGGLIGVETAEILHHRGLHVTFVIRENWYFPLALDGRESALVAEHMRQEGIDVRLGINVDEILRKNGQVQGVRAGGGEIPCDLVVTSIGVVPNTDFLKTSGLNIAKSGAIEVDDALKTSASDVWAAGDCANVTWFDGSRRPEQLWYTARDQGRVAAAAMLGDGVTYKRGTWYNSAKFFDIEWTTAGWVPALLNFDNTAIDPGPDVRTWFQRVPGHFESQKIVLKGDRVVGFNMIGSRWSHEPMLQWIHERRGLEYVLEHLHEAQFDEEFSRRFEVLPEATVIGGR